MTTNRKETLLDWLRDAHAMEDAGVSLLEKQVKVFKDQPMVVGKLQEHLDITRTQRDRLKEAIQSLGGDTSKVKDLAGTLFANVQGMMGATPPDAIVKNALANYAIENFEIACYTSLVAAAQAEGKQEVVRICQQILEEERDMAGWLQSSIPRITNEYLGQKTATR